MKQRVASAVAYLQPGGDVVAAIPDQWTLFVTHKQVVCGGARDAGSPYQMSLDGITRTTTVARVQSELADFLHQLGCECPHGGPG